MMDDQDELIKNSNAFVEFKDGPGNASSHVPSVGSASGIMAERSSNVGEDFDLIRKHQSRTSISEFATPLFGLVVRLRNLQQFEDVPTLHENTKLAIETFRRDLQNEGYDLNNLNAASYSICALIDESVMAHQWGAESLWPSQSMLSVFHNETWGGDQFFTILDRVISEANRYPDLLEFMQMCLLLGFEGKYHIMPNGDKLLDETIHKIDGILRRQNPERARTRFVAPENNVHAKPKRGWDVPMGPWAILGLTALLLAAFYLVLYVLLDGQMTDIEDHLKNSLNWSPSSQEEGL